MPELPEVETIRRSLSDWIRKSRRQVEGLKVFREELLKNSTIEELQDKFGGAFIDSLERRAKYLIFNFSNHHSIVLHLGMEGRLLLDNKCLENVQLIVYFGDNSELYLDDIRNYSRLYFVRSDEVGELNSISKLGIEPFTNDFTFENFSALLDSRQEIKRLLLDQSKIAGLGNIYASEVLFICGIHPERQANKLTMKEAQRLYKGIPELLGKAIEKRGTTIFKYRDIDGSKGEFQNYLEVYGRKGKNCGRCGGTIEEMEQGGRKTYLCPSCQSLRKD